MRKVVGVLLSLALCYGLPAVAVAQDPNPDGEVTGCGPEDTVCGSGSDGSRGETEPDGGGDTTSSGNTQTGDIDQDAEAGPGGNAGNQACLIQQNAGRDANAACSQTQNFNTTTTVNGGGAPTQGQGGGHFHGEVDGGGDTQAHSFGLGGGHNHGGGNVASVGVGGGVGGVVGGGVQNVALAQTGFDAWMPAVIGGALLASVLGLLAAQRRGRRSA